MQRYREVYKFEVEVIIFIYKKVCAFFSISSYFTSTMRLNKIFAFILLAVPLISEEKGSISLEFPDTCKKKREKIFSKELHETSAKMLEWVEKM